MKENSGFDPPFDPLRARTLAPGQRHHLPGGSHGLHAEGGPPRGRRGPRSRGETPGARDLLRRRGTGTPRVALPGPGRDRARRAGRGPEGPRPRPGSRRGREGPARALQGGRARHRALRRGGADRRAAPAPGHRAGLRARPAGGRAPVLRHEAGEGRDAGRPAPPAPATHRGPAAPAARLPPGLSDRGLRPREARRPPRSQAVEHPGGCLRRGPGGRLGAGEGAGRRRHRRRARRLAHGQPDRDGAHGRGLHGLHRGLGDGGHRPTCRRSRRAATWNAWTLAPTSSAWARSCARS